MARVPRKNHVKIIKFSKDGEGRLVTRSKGFEHPRLQEIVESVGETTSGQKLIFSRDP